MNSYSWDTGAHQHPQCTDDKRDTPEHTGSTFFQEVPDDTLIISSGGSQQSYRVLPSLSPWEAFNNKRMYFLNF